jgi:type VI secretion system protein ImpK
MVGAAGEEMYWAAADVLILATQLSSSPDMPPPAELRSRIIGMLDRMVTDARAAQIPESEIAEARYALVAFVDERILRSTWPGRTEWMNQPLQLVLYREYTAGENFFARLRTLLDHGGHPRAIQIYYLCLALGFRGAHDSANTNVADSFLEGAHQYFARFLPLDPRLSPHGIPRDRAEAERHSSGLLIGVLAACTFVLIVTLSLMGWSLHRIIGDAVQTLASAAR